jgi:hypothetical protein
MGRHVSDTSNGTFRQFGQSLFGMLDPSSHIANFRGSVLTTGVTRCTGLLNNLTARSFFSHGVGHTQSQNGHRTYHHPIITSLHDDSSKAVHETSFGFCAGQF